MQDNQEILLNSRLAGGLELELNQFLILKMQELLNF